MQANISLPQLYELTKTKLGADVAESWLTYIDNRIDTQLENKTKVLATKEDLHKLESKLTRWGMGAFVFVFTMMIGVYTILLTHQSKINDQFDRVNEKFEKVNERITNVEKNLNERINGLEKSLIRIEHKLDKK